MFAKKITVLPLALCQLISPAMASDDFCQVLEKDSAPDAAAAFTQIFTDADCETDHTACRWTFQYRSRDANTVAEGLHSTIMKCDGLVSVTKDTPVNHPDSYQAHIFNFATNTLVLSIKDKAALNQTFVTLRAGPQY